MHTNINPQKANTVSLELLELSRAVRRSRDGIEDVQHQLQSLTELDECKAALRKQEEALAGLTAKLVNMSSALREIAEVYQNTEDKIQESLDERPRPYRQAGEVVIYGVNDTMHRQIRQILYK